MGRKVGQIVMAGLCFMALATVAAGQSTTTNTRTTKFEIIAVDGNNVVVRTPTGTRELTLPDDFKMTVNGQPVSVHDLKPGMAGTAEVTTTTTMKPVTVTEVKNGTVMKKVGNSIIVRTADNQIKMFSEADVEKRQARIIKDGQPVSIADLNEGDHLSATIVTERPPKVMTEQQVNATLTPAGGSTAPARASRATPAPAAAPAPESTVAEARPAKHLPKTASELPLLALAGGVLMAIGGVLTLRRRTAR